MKALLLAFLIWQAAEGVRSSVMPDQRYFHYRRGVAVSAASPAEGGSGQACATLDAPVYANAAPSLKDLRLYQGAHEMPYAITLSESAEADSEPATVLNAGVRSGKIVFDLAMPDRLYTDVLLDLEGHDFIAAAEVSGSNRPGETPTLLGTFTLFDLSAQHLSRSTTLHLQESRFHTLHVELSVSAVPGAVLTGALPVLVRGAAVPPSREAQTLYTPVANTGTLLQRGRQTVATFRVPARVPVERISFAIDPGFAGNFSRDVRVIGRAEGTPESASEAMRGTIFRVRLSKAGREIRQEQLSVAATLGANLQANAVVEVVIDNGDDLPLPVSSVSLEMRERRLCLPVTAASELALFYGDVALDAPVYDFARLLSLSAGVVPAQLGAEQANPMYVARPAAKRPLTERHPELLWVVLLGVICVLAAVATHSARKMPR